MEMNVKEFDETARLVFKPVYPIIADQILSRTGVSRGTCLDIGCGGGYLGLELLRKSALEMRFLDKSSEMLEIVEKNLAEHGLLERGEAILANAEGLPLPDNSVDLVISRGSVFFWEDHASAFSEVYRVLKPGGSSYIGGGFGSLEVKEEIGRRFQAYGKDEDMWRGHVKRNLGPDMRQKFEDALEQAGLSNYELLHKQGVEMWIVIRKEK